MRATVFLAALAFSFTNAVAQDSDPQIWSGVFSVAQADRGRGIVAPGSLTFELLNPFPSPAAHVGRRVHVKGLLIRNPGGDRINVVPLEPVAPTCAR